MRSLPIQPNGERPALGARLRAVREQQHMTLEQMSQVTDLSKGFISRVERDLTSPSVSSLLTMCQVLGISAGHLLEPSGAVTVEWKNAPEVVVDEEGVDVRMMTPPGNKSHQVVRSIISPGAKGGTELFTLPCDEQSIHVTQGALTIVDPQGEVTLKAGDSMTLPGNEPHNWYNPSNRDKCLVLTVMVGLKA